MYYFAVLCRYLLASMDSDNIKLTYVSCGMNKDLTLQWIHQIKDVSTQHHDGAYLFESIYRINVKRFYSKNISTVYDYEHRFQTIPVDDCKQLVVL